MIRAAAERLRNLAALALRIWIFTGVLLRVTRLRDAFDPLAVVFYTTPWPVIAGGMAILALHHWRCNHPHRMRRYIVLTAGALLIWVALSWYSASPSSERPGIRICFWNVADADKSVPRIARWMHKEEPDVIAIAEAANQRPSAIRRWQSEFPEHRTRRFLGNMLLLVRGELLGSDGGVLGRHSYYVLSRIRVRGQPLTVLQVDLFARPSVSRREALLNLTSIVRAHAHEQLIVLGDFNTPRESAHFDPLRRELTNCFEQAGYGFIETWPGPLPLLSLDQVWTSRSLSAVRCRIGGPLVSDHRAVTVDLVPVGAR